MILRPLSDTFGVEVMDVDLNKVADGLLYPEIRTAFEMHSALLFRAQSVSPEEHVRLARQFGPLEDRKANERRKGEGFEISQVSNVMAEGTVSDEMDLHTLHLKSNQLWHTDSTFLPVPALANILMARTVTSTGGETEIASTRSAWRDMPARLKDRVRHAAIWHKYSQSRARVSEELARLPMFNKWPD